MEQSKVTFIKENQNIILFYTMLLFCALVIFVDAYTDASMLQFDIDSYKESLAYGEKGTMKQVLGWDLIDSLLGTIMYSLTWFSIFPAFFAAIDKNKKKRIIMGISTLIIPILAVVLYCWYTSKYDVDIKVVAQAVTIAMGYSFLAVEVVVLLGAAFCKFGEWRYKNSGKKYGTYSYIALAFAIMMLLYLYMHGTTLISNVLPNLRLDTGSFNMLSLLAAFIIVDFPFIIAPICFRDMAINMGVKYPDFNKLNRQPGEDPNAYFQRTSNKFWPILLALIFYNTIIVDSSRDPQSYQNSMRSFEEYVQGGGTETMIQYLGCDPLADWLASYSFSYLLLVFFFFLAFIPKSIYQKALKIAVPVWVVFSCMIGSFNGFTAHGWSLTFVAVTLIPCALGILYVYLWKVGVDVQDGINRHLQLKSEVISYNWMWVRAAIGSILLVALGVFIAWHYHDFIRDNYANHPLIYGLAILSALVVLSYPYALEHWFPVHDEENEQ